MWAPVVNNVVAIVGFGVFVMVFGDAQSTDVATAATWTSAQVALIAGASTLRGVAQAVVLVPALRPTRVG
jgi:putative peptidoglycan lipid II flippase